ncbi:hypothetical protein H2201_008853 [Coniosporium apollinis]|uniref:S-adenosyl-L-methionine-dependent methyltransferase n=1 Tax=Coniosporium apollinis TaxID=61459 RepID=A0ABQ9NFR8_9PEZI|nr:hypothetical protein H2201_008853 [Coniosporium apollinis]
MGGHITRTEKEVQYAIPNDEIENDRLDLQHAVFGLTIDGKLFLAPAKPIHNCLDVGTGTGIWAIDFADEHPESQVVAIDLSPIQPTNIPPNLRFIIDDAEDVWHYKQEFDLIHARMMVGSLADWDKFLDNCMRRLRPGGWIELQDVYTLGCDDDTLAEDAALSRWWRLVGKAFDKMNRPMIIADKHKQRLINAGFVDVQEAVYKWPMNTWPRDKRLKNIGLFTRENTLQALEALALAPLTRELGWSTGEVQVLLAKAREDIKNPSVHAYWKM